jgi:recombinational DNA repair ATPase RecF
MVETVKQLSALKDAALFLSTRNFKASTRFLGILNAVQFSSLDLELVRGRPNVTP